MSLILEALRKSEAERRRGQVPNLHSELPPVAPPARSRQSAWPWLLALAVLAMIATAWLARGWWAPTAPVADTSDQVRAVADREAPARVDSSVMDVAPAAASPARPATASIDPAPQPRLEPAEPAAPRVRDNDSDGDRRTAITATAPPAALPSPRPIASAAAVDAGTNPSEPGSAERPAAATTDTTSPLRLSDLAAAERRALPPLKVSMHLWAPTSARRFAIIDGARVNEGDRLDDAVVDEITRDGVVLAWRGRRVHIPIH